MKIDIYIGGRKRQDWAIEGIEHFIKLLKPYAQISIETFPSEKGSSLNNIGALLNRISSDMPVVILDQSGHATDSNQFAALIKNISAKNGKLAFFIGGPEGFSRDIIGHCENVISLSSMTFSHRLALVILLEQLYRAFDISSKGKYQR